MYMDGMGWMMVDHAYRKKALHKYIGYIQIHMNDPEDDHDHDYYKKE